MKKKLLFPMITAVVLFAASRASAASGYAIASGNWNSPNTWIIDGAHADPGCGDTLSISADVKVVVSAQANYTYCSEPMNIVVGGELQFTNGFKLDLPDGSTVTILPGGVIRKITPGGGNSTLISICGITVWSARDGDLFGPKVLGCLTLPVSLLSFDVHPSEGNVIAAWSTASEVNNDYFLLQRSADGETYEDLAKIRGSGNSAEQHDYSYLDKFPLNGHNYYRLTQVDFDGHSQSWSPAVVNVPGKNRIILYPNPASPIRFNLQFTGDKATSCDISLTDMNGKNCFRQSNRLLRSGSNVVEMHEALAEGIYVVTVLAAGEEFREKLVVSHDQASGGSSEN